MTIEFELAGQKFAGINVGPLFKFNPSVSFLAACRDSAEVDRMWEKLSQSGGPALMDLGEYPFSERYGWTQDRYGLSWQVLAMGSRGIKQKIIPTLMYAGAQWGRAEAAVRLYAKVFPGSAIADLPWGDFTGASRTGSASTGWRTTRIRRRAERPAPSRGTLPDRPWSPLRRDNFRPSALASASLSLYFIDRW